MVQNDKIIFIKNVMTIKPPSEVYKILFFI